ncbi:rhomboid-like protein [Streptomyces sp. NPDC020096]
MTASDHESRKGRRVTPREAARVGVRAVGDWVGHSPGTHIWLLVLAVTSGVIAVVSPGVRNFLLHHNSTNLVQLRDHPIRVLFVSALWIETPSGFLIYGVFFELIHAPAERWLGTWRWLVTVAIAHVGATLVSQQAVRLGIQYERLPKSMAHTVDIGVSYGLAGVIGILAYLVPRPWRWGYLVLVTGFFGWSVVNGRTFTDLGHFTALMLGFACYAMTPTARARRPRRPGGPPSSGGSRSWPGAGQPPRGGRLAVRSRVGGPVGFEPGA